MIDVKDIFVWYRDLPRVPENFTSVQIEDWNREHATLFAKSFVGQHVTSCYARVLEIDHETIKAYGDYHLDYLVFHDGSHFHHAPGTSRRNYTQISYVISYDEVRFRNTIRLIHKGQMIACSGLVTDARWQVGGRVTADNPGGMLFLQLALLSLESIDETFLHAELLDSTLRYRAKSSCFIATAAFESPEAEEVRVLRQFRDDVLARHRGGSFVVRFYEVVSPAVASLVSVRPPLRRLVRVVLRSVAVPIARHCLSGVRTGRFVSRVQ